jgi:hypothetical protein
VVSAGYINQIHNVLPLHLIVSAHVNHPVSPSTQFLLEHVVISTHGTSFKFTYRLGIFSGPRLFASTTSGSVHGSLFCGTDSGLRRWAHTPRGVGLKAVDITIITMAMSA